MEKKKTQAIVQQFLQYLTERDIKKITNLFSESIDWDIPGNTHKAPWLGKRNSREEVKEFYQLLWKNTEPVEAQVDKFLVEENYAVIIGEFTTRMLATHKIVNSFFCIQLTVENNLITKYRLFEDSYAVSEALTV